MNSDDIKALHGKILDTRADIAAKTTAAASRLSDMHARAVKAFGPNSKEVKKIEKLHDAALRTQDKNAGALRAMATPKIGETGKQSEHQKASGAGGEHTRTMPKQVPIGTDGGRWITMNGRRMFIKG